MKARRSVKTHAESLSGFSEDFMSERKQPPVQVRSSTVDEMKLVPFSAAFDVMSDAGKRVKQRDYLPVGKIPVIDQGQTFIGGYTNEQDFLYGGSLPVIIFGDHTKKIKLVNQPFAVGADGVKILKSKPEFVPKFLYYFLQIVDLPDKGYARHFQFLRKSEFPYTSLERQKEIVSEIEKQFSRLDEAVAGLKRIKANLKRYKASVLKAAVEGKLTEEWRKAHSNVETGAQLLKRILAERKKKWDEKNPGKKNKEPIGPDTSNLTELPEGWVWATLGKLIDEPKYGTSKKCDYETDGIGVLRIPNVANEVVDVSDLKFAEFDENEIKTYKLREGDILTIRSNGSVSLVGKCALLTKADEKYLYAGYLIRMRPSSSAVYSKYLMICFSSLLLRKQIESKAKSTSGVNNINAGELQSLMMPICGRNEQKEIVRLVDEKLSSIDYLVHAVELNLKRVGRLRQSILRKAFGNNCHGKET